MFPVVLSSFITQYPKYRHTQDHHKLHCYFKQLNAYGLESILSHTLATDSFIEKRTHIIRTLKSNSTKLHPHHTHHRKIIFTHSRTITLYMLYLKPNLHFISNSRSTSPRDDFTLEAATKNRTMLYFVWVTTTIICCFLNYGLKNIENCQL